MKKEDFVPTQEMLKKILYYDPETGYFEWLIGVGTVHKGKPAGYIHHTGYTIIAIGRKKYLSHRLAFLYMEGAFPPKFVDHINRDRGDCRWCNLRHATHSQNMRNRVDNSVFIGVRRTQNKWQALSSVSEGKTKYLGVYVTHFAACYARWAYDMNNRINQHSQEEVI